MGFVNRAFVAAGVGFAVSAIAGCGSSGGTLLSQSQASTLSGQLNQVQAALDAGECARAQSYLNDFENRINQLGGVDSTLVANLNQGESTIASLTSTECAGQTVTTRKTHTTRTRTSTTTTTTATQTIPTFTQTTTTTTYPQQSDTYTEPPTTTSPNGGVGPSSETTTTPLSTSTTTTTPGNGGSGLGGNDTSTTSTGSDTSTTSGSGF